MTISIIARKLLAALVEAGAGFHREPELLQRARLSHGSFLKARCELQLAGLVHCRKAGRAMCYLITHDKAALASGLAPKARKQIRELKHLEVNVVPDIPHITGRFESIDSWVDELLRRRPAFSMAVDSVGADGNQLKVRWLDWDLTDIYTVEDCPEGGIDVS